MKRIFFVLILAFLLPSCVSRKVEKPPAKKPLNILFIMTDDHAEQAISSYGSKLIDTPNIDRIANEGIRFTNSFVTNSICAPSRAVMLTGKYSHLNGLRDNRDRFDGSQMTFPKLLQKAGYFTAVVGKWHLKTEPTGFDDWNVLIGQGAYYNPTMIDNGDTLRHTGYTTDVITDIALETLEKRDKSKPFCLLYHHKAPHRNWMPAPRHFSMYKDEDLPLPATFFDNYEGREAAAHQDMRVADMYLSMDMKLMPEDFGEETGTGGHATYDVVKAWLDTYNRMTPEQKAAWDAHYDPIRKEFREKQPSGKDLAVWKYQRYIKDYLRSVAAVDENIGRVLDYLDKNGLAENTLVVYTSDQGFYLGEHGWYDKRFMYEESLGMPLVMRLPGMIKSGEVSDAMVLNLDFAPTFLDIAGVEIPEEMQGNSLRPLFDNQTPDSWRKSMYYHYYEYPHGWHSVKQHYGVRTYQHKLIYYYNDDTWELFDLLQDPAELNNIYGVAGNEAITSALKEELLQLRELYGEVESSGP